MRALFILTLILFGWLTNLRASDAETLVETLKRTAAPGNGISDEEQEVARKLQSIGAEAIPYLLTLLRDKNEDVRALASFTLCDIEGLTEEHLDALIESRRRGDGWIPPAIARIGTPKAVTFLVKELVRERQTQTQLTFAMELLGEKAVPQLVQVYQTGKGWNDQLEQTMDSVFKALGSKAVEAIDPLLKIANDETAPRKKRIRAMLTVGAIGLPAERAVPHLQKLQRHRDVELRNSAALAILRIGSAEAAPILAQILDETTDQSGKRLLMRDIAELKTRGKSAGPVVAKYLTREDWDIRVGAARALGYIGYTEAADDLIKLLNRGDDWRLVLSGAESLGRLKAERALPALAQLSKDHWYPPVREAALVAVKAIRDSVPAEARDSEDFPSEFFGYEHVGREMESLQGEDAKSIRFPVAATPDQPVTVAIKGKKGAVKNEQRRGVKVEDGHLVGTDRGEWGGQITFIDSKGNSRVLAEENTEAIYKTPQGIFAITGLAHITLNSGFIYKIDKAGEAGWVAKKWRALPGAPRFSRLLEDGQLFVSCHGGIVLVSPEGEMKSLTRSESLNATPSPR